MTAAEKRRERFTIAEYLASEATSEIKHEYEDGLILAMSGGSLNHSLIGGNVNTTLNNALREEDKGCLVFNSDARVYIEAANSFVYPDATVVCGDLETAAADPQAIANPLLIVEVLSASTSHYDRGNKFKKYQTLPSLREYVLIDQSQAVVDVFFKENEQWIVESSIGLSASVYLHALDISLPLAELYRNVPDLDPPLSKVPEDAK